ncbi:hypothetical protein ASPBRDRAFT_385684 [Aspergillus brasiliensis CBS 101740]|uniref:Uncharacterized protein n=1 Tax=Aspergillus brasiliensis (strain CBS 101740 / IMI 381727 / IBT 21946) TaxID=767769 RepID=A0A1L9UW18_ASPBC|nr:hypothetical protein ASPBRDRAFT_385684 [Aspergillus brasiliensis CBS 101740]
MMDEPRSIICNLASLAFSGFHLVAWNWDFPSAQPEHSGGYSVLLRQAPLWF